MPAVTVRDVRPGDAEAVAGILNRIIEARVYTVLDTPFSVEEERRFIEAFPARGTFLVAASREDLLEPPTHDVTHVPDVAGVLER